MTIVRAVKPWQRDQVAYHESGHGVISVLRRRPLHFITIEADENGPGRSEYHPRSRDVQLNLLLFRDRERLEAFIDTAVAGAAATTVHLGYRRPWSTRGCSSDRQSAMALALLAAGGDVKAAQHYLAYRYAAVHRELATRSCRIGLNAVASELLAHPRGRLTGREVRAIYRGAVHADVVSRTPN
jgi:hypothetical protein